MKLWVKLTSRNYRARTAKLAVEQIARTYARSLFEVAAEQGNLDTVKDQLSQIDQAMQSDQDLKLFFGSPLFNADEKKRQVPSTFEGAEPILLNLLGLMAENHRLPLIGRVRRAFEILWREERKLLAVEITSAVPLDSEAAKRIGDEIGQRTGRTVELTQQVDADLVGGLTLRVGNQILDSSIRNRLETLRRQVIAG